MQFQGLERTQVGQLLTAANLSFFYTPEHFAATTAVNEYRAQLGKRPPLATVELIWTPYAGPVHLIAGFVVFLSHSYVAGFDNVSTFDADTEGWTIVGGDLSHSRLGGNPGGHLIVCSVENGATTNVYREAQRESDLTTYYFFFNKRPYILNNYRLSG